MKREITVDFENRGERQSNFELLRIVLMFLIVAHHYAVNAGFQDVFDLNHITGNMIFIQFLAFGGKVGVNGFFLISGYFMVNSTFKLKKFMKLFCQVLFYNLLLFIIFLIAGYPTGIKEILYIIPGIMGLPATFIGTYMFIYLMTPMLNKAIKSLTERQHLALIGILIFYFSILGTFLNRNTWHYLGWAITLYIVAAYIRLYPHQLFEKRNFFGILAIGSILVMWLSEITFDLIGSEHYYYLITDANKITVFLCALGMFLYFKNLNIGNSGLINIIAQSTFGVFLIHANSDTMRQFLWKDFLHNTAFYDSSLLIVHALLSIIGIYVVCTIIDQGRIHFIEKPFFNKMDKTFDKCELKLKEIGNNIYRIIST